MPAAFLIVDIDVTDDVGYQAYRQLVGPIVAASGGRFIVRGGAIDVLEGEWRPKRVVMLEFPSMATALDWYHGESYAEAKALRLRTSRCNVVLVEGLPDAAA